MCIPYEETFPFIPKFLTLWPWPWPLTYILVSQNLTFVITFEPLEVGFHISCVYSLWWGLPIHTKIFDLVTLTVTFDLHTCISKFNICHNFWTIRGRGFIFHIYIPCDEDFPLLPKLKTLWPSPWPLTHISENFNICHNFWTISGRTLIFHMHIRCDEAFLLIPKVTFRPWPWPFTYLIVGKL